MDELGELFPIKSGRYTVRPSTRPWSLNEDFILWPILLSCESDRAYLEACGRICEILDRIPVFDHIPTRSEVIRESKDIIERRTITEMMSPGRPGMSTFSLDVFGKNRSGKPLTWAERERFLKPYYRKKRDRIAVPLLMCLLERDSSDLPMIADFLAECPHDPPSMEKLDAPRPFDPKHFLVTGDHVRRFINIPPKSEYLKTHWRYVHNFVGSLAPG